jgi:hypothetical protein
MAASPCPQVTMIGVLNTLQRMQRFLKRYNPYCFWTARVEDNEKG